MTAEELQCSKSNYSPQKPLWGSILLLFPQSLDKSCRCHQEAEALGRHSHREGCGTLTGEQMSLVAASPGAVWGSQGGSCGYLCLAVAQGVKAEPPLFPGVCLGTGMLPVEPEATQALFYLSSRAEVPVTKAACAPPGQRQNLQGVGGWQTKKATDGAGVPWARFIEPGRFAGQILALLGTQMLID